MLNFTILCIWAARMQRESGKSFYEIFDSSLGVVETLGFQYVGEGRAIRLNNSSNIMKWDRIDGLYFLQGNIVTSAVVVSVSDDPDLDITCLWHMCLDNMSKKKGMSILNKQGLLGDQNIGKIDFCEYCLGNKAEFSLL